MCLFCWTQRKIFWRKFVIRLFWGTIDFTSRKNKYCGSQWCPRTSLFPSFFRISSFVFSRTNTFMQVWKYLRMSKWQNFNFWVYCPFKAFICGKPKPSCSRRHYWDLVFSPSCWHIFTESLATHMVSSELHDEQALTLMCFERWRIT